MLEDDAGRALRRVLSADALDEVAFGIHHVEVDAVVDQVVLLAGLQILRRGEVDPVDLACVFDLLPGARQALDLGVELGQVGFEDGGRVAGGIDGDEERFEGVGGAGVEDVDCGGEFVEFVGADVGAVGEAEVDLSGC